MIIAEAEKNLVIGKVTIPFTIVKGRRNRVRLFFSEESTLIIETGTGKIEAFDRTFLENKARWVSKGFQWYKRENEHRQKLLSGIESKIQILGTETPVNFIESPKTWFRYRKHTDFSIYAPRPWLEENKKRLLFQSLRKFALQFLTMRTEYWKQATGTEVKVLRVRDLRSKWGSCSSLGNVSLNWHLIFMEEKVIDYVVIHELMHLREMNHSASFWNWVAAYMPDYKVYDNKLKENQWMIGILK
jgi:predicted metal-dependent hydrolase